LLEWLVFNTTRSARRLSRDLACFGSCFDSINGVRRRYLNVRSERSPITAPPCSFVHETDRSRCRHLIFKFVIEHDRPLLTFAITTLSSSLTTNGKPIWGCLGVEGNRNFVTTPTAWIYNNNNNNN